MSARHLAIAKAPAVPDRGPDRKERAMRTLSRWARYEPVRTRLYPVVVALATVLVARGVTTDEEAGLLLAVAGVLIGAAGAVGVESARAVVTPTAKLDSVGDVLRWQRNQST